MASFDPKTGRFSEYELPLKDILRTGPKHPANVQLANGDVIFLPAKKGPKKTALDTLIKVTPLAALFAAF